jgi:hypothetical protein
VTGTLLVLPPPEEGTMTRRPAPILTAILTAALTGVLLALSGAAAVVPAATAAAGQGRAAAHYRLNPRHNITPPKTVYGSACRNRPRGARCTANMLAALNHAHGVMGQPKYALPARFASLAPQEQLLVLSNADRALYRRTPVTGLNGRLNRSAAAGARHNSDPAFVPTVNGAQAYGYSGNWAGGTAPMNTPLFAYYEWMFDDGPGSGNIDCRHAGDSGCWGHRDDTLITAPAGTQVEMGVGAAKPHGLYSWTEMYEVFAQQAAIPCVPTITALSRYREATSGGRLIVHGAGFVGVRKVTVLGVRAPVVRRSPTSLTITAPAHAARSGYVIVTTSGGTSNRTRAAAFRYAG